MKRDESVRTPNWKRRPDWLLRFLSTQSRGRLVAWFAGMYALPILTFAALYRWLDLLRDGGGHVRSYWSSLYFSLIIQATGGFLDITTSNVLGRVLVSSQTLIGVTWTAFLPAIVLIRLAKPDFHSLEFGQNIAFNPKTGRFAFRYASFSRLVIFHTDITIWVRLPAPVSGEYNNNPVKVRSTIASQRRFGNIRPGVPFLVYTDSAEPTIPAVFPEYFEEIILHPAHMTSYDSASNALAVMIDIAGSTSVGTVHAFREFRYENIVCGTYASVQPRGRGTKHWENFHQYVGQTDTPEGREFCLTCHFRPTCALSNRYDGEATSDEDRSGDRRSGTDALATG